MQRIGRRYADVTLDSFELSRERGVAPKQRAVIARMKSFVGLIEQEITIGRNLTLFGPVGTGKDHLLACAMRAACQAGFDVEWVNGMDLFGAVRDQIDTEQSEARLLSQWIGPSVLAISDPLPPWGPLTPFQAATLFRIVDRRYRDRKPVWITGNFKDGAEAEDRVGAQAIDRIRDGALCLSCDWPSYRRAAE